MEVRMKLKELVREIEKLPFSDKIYIVEEILHSIKEEKEKESMLKAADILKEEYENNDELTAFTALDFEDFYETR